MVDGRRTHPGATNAVYQTTGPGLYAVSVTDFADCPGAISDDWLVVEVQETVEPLRSNGGPYTPIPRHPL